MVAKDTNTIRNLKNKELKLEEAITLLLLVQENEYGEVFA